MRKATKRIAACTLSAAMALTLVPAASLAQAAQATDATAEQAATATDQAAAGQTADGQTVDTEVAKVTSAIDALPALKQATHDDNTAIKAAHKAYSALSDSQKAQVGAARVAKLDELYNAYEAAVAVSEEIKALPSVSKVSANDYASIKTARKHYDKLAQKALVSSERAEKLASLESAVLYTATPALTYKVKSTSGATTTVSDTKAHTFKGGIGKIKFYQPKSGVNAKTKLSATVSYGLRTYGQKTTATSKAGTWLGSSSSKRTTQGLKLKISGTTANHYTVYYRVKVSKLGWSNWAKSGKWAGSTGMNLRLTGLQVKFVAKGSSAPGSTAKPSLGRSTLSYRVNALKGGWTSYKKSGSTAGTASWKAGIKQVQLKTSGDLDGKAESSILMRKGGWTSYTSGISGSSSSKSKQAQAVRIKLTGELSKVYNVYYRVYASDHHWLGWAENGEKAGTQGHKYAMGAIQVQLRLKGTGAPGSTSQHFTTKAVPSYSGGQLTMMRKAQQYSSSTGWLVLVNRSTTHVGVFTGSKNDWTLKKYFICDVGASSTPTPKGTRHVQYRIPSFGESKGYSVYKATNIGGGYFFHSILYYANTMSVMDGTLGSWCSHGCIRLAYGNAKYIYDNVSNGTTVKIY